VELATPWRGEIMQTNACCAVATAKADKEKLHQTIGNAFNGNNNGVNRNNANNHNDNGSFRAAIRVYKLWTDFSHPPSIRPISANFDCIWNTIVSFATESSSNSLSFKVDISSLLLVLIKYPAFKGLGAFLAIISSSRHSTIEFSRLIPRPYLLRFVMWIFMFIIFL